VKLHAAAMLLIGSALYAQIPELDRLVGKDLWKEPGARERVNAVLGEAHAWKLGEPEPWHVWKTSSGALQYVVLLGASLFEIPGESSARVYFLDAAGKTINAWSFLVGYRIKLNEASIEFSRALASDLIVLSTAPVIKGLDIGREYYAISHDRLRLVRLENSDGRATQNEYINGNWEIGVVPDATSADQFASLLESKD